MTRSTRALITGIAGQDGSYLAELLCAEGVEVHGALRGPLDRELPNLEALRDRLVLHVVDTDLAGRARPRSRRSRRTRSTTSPRRPSCPTSWVDPAATMRAIAASAGELIGAVRVQRARARVVVASSREIFGR